MKNKENSRNILMRFGLGEFIYNKESKSPRKVVPVGLNYWIDKLKKEAGCKYIMTK
jgi:prefoldin subunit 5